MSETTNEHAPASVASLQERREAHEARLQAWRSSEAHTTLAARLQAYWLQERDARLESAP